MPGKAIVFVGRPSISNILGVSKMAKERTIYECTNCQAQFPAWMGKCTECGAWNTVEKASFGKAADSSAKDRAFGEKPLKMKEIVDEVKLFRTGINEFDRVVGGGIVPGSLLLIGGDPGIGKSTLVMQLCAGFLNCNRGKYVLYVSGEESLGQIKMRADRIGIKDDSMEFLTETNVEYVISILNKKKPAFAIIDSIQTMVTEDALGSAGSVSQVRATAAKLMGTAKRANVALLLIGHVTKEGAVAGPRTLEHLVDTVLYLEGDRYQTYRILRGVKNRFGSTNETGVFEMKEEGLVEVKDPSGIFLEERTEGITGSSVAVTIEGTRPLLVEVQALTSPTSFGYPKRTASGIDFNRLSLLIAVLTKRAHLNLSSQDVFVNVVGGFKVKEPAVDLAVCLAIASAFLDKSVGNQLAAIGEVGLSGEIRQVSFMDRRLQEASKLGFKKIAVPKITKNSLDVSDKGRLIVVRTILEAIEKILK
ncbi:MAG: hypothetical protein ACD_63C00137G0003 [uncultured bacterium]|nr:MAG: hypothetical protein ACD_63C00137G0003 [uncultured bacterium]